MVKRMLYRTKPRDGIRSQSQQFPNSILIWQSWEYRTLRKDSSSPLCDALRSWVSQGLSHNQAFWEAAK